MFRNTQIRKQRGFTIIEALFSSIVLGIGLMALAGFHAVALKDGTAVKMRMVATNLAQEKIDDLKSFSMLNDGDDDDNDEAISSSNKCGLGNFCYAEIATDAGGQEYLDTAGHTNGDLKIPAASTTISNTTYTLSWEVTCSLAAAGSAMSFVDDTELDTTTADTTDTVCDNAAAKRVVVTVTWTDNQGADQSAVLETVIFGFDPTKIARATGGFGPAPGPDLTYVPVGVPDGAPVEVGDEQYKESSKPVPDLSAFGYSTVTTFDTTAYTAPDNIIDTREEFTVLSCVCEFNGDGQGMTPTRLIWNGYALEPELGVMVSKTVGRKPTSGTYANQATFCDICCRDHHDVSGTTYPKYDTKRYVDNSEGVHKHYWPDGGGVLQEVTSGNYLESCRLKRVNGFWRVMQDWRMVDMVVMPKDDYLAVDDTFTAYQNYLQTAMAYYGLGVGSAPDKGTLVNRNFLQLASGQAAQLLARAMYVDPIYQCRPGAKGLNSGNTCPVGKDPTALDSTYISDVQAIKTANDATNSWRKHVSFYEVNLTMLTAWASNNTSYVTVDNQPVQDIVDVDTGYYTTYYRGRVHAGTSAGTATITATTRKSNTSLTSGVMSAAGNPDGYGADPHDDSNTLSDSITVERLASVTTWGITGNLLLTFTGPSNKPKPNAWGVTASPSSGVVCNSTGTAASPGYSCTVPNNWSGTITPFATAGGPGNDVAGTTYYYYPTSRTYSNVTAAQTNQHYKLCKDSSLCVP